jgi:hypothetical protein
VLVLLILAINVFVTCRHSNFTYCVKLEGFVTLKYMIISEARTISWPKSSYSCRTSGHYIDVSGLHVRLLLTFFIGDMNLNSVEYFLLGISPASELSESTFRNLVSVPSS